MSWPRKFKRSNEGCGSHADEGDFGAEGEYLSLKGDLRVGALYMC